MEDAEMDESFYKKLKEREIKWELPVLRSLPLFDTDKARAGFEQAAKETMKKELSDLRDHFAGLAMQGCFAAFKHYPYEGEIDKVAVIAYEAADAMLKQRSLTND